MPQRTPRLFAIVNKRFLTPFAVCDQTSLYVVRVPEVVFEVCGTGRLEAGTASHLADLSAEDVVWNSPKEVGA